MASDDKKYKRIITAVNCDIQTIITLPATLDIAKSRRGTVIKRWIHVTSSSTTKEALIVPRYVGMICKVIPPTARPTLGPCAIHVIKRSDYNLTMEDCDTIMQTVQTCPNEPRDFEAKLKSQFYIPVCRHLCENSRTCYVGLMLSINKKYDAWYKKVKDFNISTLTMLPI